MDGDVMLFLAGVLLSIPIGIGVNLLTPWIQRVAGRVSTSSRERTRKRLAAELSFVSKLQQNPRELAMRLVQGFTLAFIFYIVGNAIWAAPLWIISQVGAVIAGVVATLFFAIAALLVLNQFRIASKVLNFEKFSADASRRLGLGPTSGTFPINES